MQISIKDYNLQNIIFVHNFVLIILIFVLLFVFVYLLLTILLFWEKVVDIRIRNKLLINFKKTTKIYHFVEFSSKLDYYLILVALFKKPQSLDKYKYFNLTHNIELEIIWTIIPIFFVLEMIFPSLSLIADDEIDHKGSIYTVGVIGNQWYWNYELNLAAGIIKYVSNLLLLEKENDAHKSLNRLLTTTKSLPIAVGIKTSFYITSNDVAHSWSLPSLGIKIDAIPGRINLKTVIATRLGLYSGMCSELCGVEHGFMPISVQVMTFSDWWYNIKDLLENINSKKIFYINDIWYILKKKKLENIVLINKQENIVLINKQENVDLNNIPESIDSNNIPEVPNLEGVAPEVINNILNSIDSKYVLKNTALKYKLFNFFFQTLEALEQDKTPIDPKDPKIIAMVKKCFIVWLLEKHNNLKYIELIKQCQAIRESVGPMVWTELTTIAKDDVEYQRQQKMVLMRSFRKIRI
jgi:heme/copper-type cytochrome/quinol oxidase subunit 2